MAKLNTIYTCRITVTPDEIYEDVEFNLEYKWIDNGNGPYAELHIIDYDLIGFEGMTDDERTRINTWIGQNLELFYDIAFKNAEWDAEPDEKDYDEDYIN